MIVMVCTLVVLGLTIIYVLTYRPRPPIYFGESDSTGLSAPVAGLPVEEESVPVRPSTPVAPKPTALVFVDDIERAASAAAGRWARASELEPVASPDSAEAALAAAFLRKAGTAADSARGDLAGARIAADAIRELSRQAREQQGFRLSVVYAAADRYVRALEQDAQDRVLYYRTLEQAVVMLVQADVAGFEIKQNVANSYRRRSEERQRSIHRLADELHASARELPAGSP
jgi:hypothetical protein